jgi:chromosome segregation ATPase
LGNGEVIVDLSDDSASIQVIVNAKGSGRIESTTSAVLVLGQNELEHIASDPYGRLELIDTRAQVNAEEIDSPMQEVSRMTLRLHTVREQLRALHDQLRPRTQLTHDLEAAEAREAELLANESPQILAKKDQLGALESELRQVQADAANMHAALSAAASASTGIESISHTVRSSLESTVRVIKDSEVSADFLSVTKAILLAEAHLSSMHSLLSKKASQKELNANVIRATIQPLREQLEASEFGLGETTAKVGAIKSSLAELASVEITLKDKKTEYDEIRLARDFLLDQLENQQEAVYAQRLKAAREITEHLVDGIEVSVKHLADTNQFQDRLEIAMAGSKLQFRPLAEKMANSLLPRQLLELAENDDAVAMADLLAIPSDRAVRALGELQNSDALQSLATTTLRDRVDFLLRQGSVVKPVDQLSTGQKCAVTLPIVLTELKRSLLLDQPEDHLDNAFLVHRVIAGLLERRASNAQTIVITHNPNIPVLGSADQVLVLSSDGQRGQVVESGKFDSVPIVEAITSLMEGGRKAFRDRAKFYSRLDPSGVEDEF